MAQAARKIAATPAPYRYKPETAEALLALYQNYMGAHDLPVWLKDLGYSALTTLETQGLPTPKLERWKYTNLVSAVKSLLGNGLGAANIEVENGDKFVQKLGGALSEAPEWLVALLSAEPAGGTQYHDMALWALSNVFLRDGVVVDIPAGTVVDKPVIFSFGDHGENFVTPRSVMRIGEGVEVTIIEHHNGQNACWNNALTQIIVGKNAKLRHYRIQDTGGGVVQSDSTHVQIERDGNYEAFTLTLGAKLSRNQIHAELLGENANCDLNGINLLRGMQHGDTTITIEHKAPHCTSNQFYRNVLDEQAKGVFQGKVHVHKIAQKTDGYQLSNTILLSEAAEMDTKPELEIYADDVKCSHGATTGQLDDEPLFYLRSRGLTEMAAKALLIEAFTNEVLDKLADEPFRVLAHAKCEGWLSDAIR